MRRRRALWIGVAIGLAAVSVVAMLWLYLPSPRTPSCDGCPFYGSTFALGSPSESSQGGNHWYNFSIESAGGGVILNNLNFVIDSSSGANVAQSAWTLHVTDDYSRLVGVYALANESWTSGGTSVVTTQQSVDLETTTAISGGTLVVLGVGSFARSDTVAIP